ncbi:hypothetical protein BO71DRAFT_393746 [Aspergillus ellipticus CBS 707.79]|uniref:Uncharacterized protein n=1 Tax=Aspergillus ellipticus CBS 707.79 TaxID=1448320 RepID=A0A319DQY1_9EURO|nr:hypothetical protein BO71DRAFT_393746 [Aspergillus ellipticus CBS 707.79]
MAWNWGLETWEDADDDDDDDDDDMQMPSTDKAASAELLRLAHLQSSTHSILRLLTEAVPRPW